MTAQVGEVPVARLGDAWPRQRVDAELAVMFSRRLGELNFLGDTTPFDQVLGQLVRGPGKRLRPAFVYWGYRPASGRGSQPPGGPARAMPGGP